MSYRQALEEIATGYIVGEKTNYKNTVDVMRSIAREALETSQTKPLSDEEIRYLVPWQVWRELPMEIKIGLVRAIEAKVRGQ